MGTFRSILKYLSSRMTNATLPKEEHMMDMTREVTHSRRDSLTFAGIDLLSPR